MNIVRLYTRTEFDHALHVDGKKLVRHKNVLDTVLFHEEVKFLEEIVQRTLAVVTAARMEAERALERARAARRHRDRMILIHAEETRHHRGDLRKVESLVVGEGNRIEISDFFARLRAHPDAVVTVNDALDGHHILAALQGVTKRRRRFLALTDDAVVRKLQDLHSRRRRTRDDAAARDRNDARIDLLRRLQDLANRRVLEGQPARQNDVDRVRSDLLRYDLARHALAAVHVQRKYAKPRLLHA